MKKLIIILFIFLLTGCQQPLGQAVPEVLDTASLHSKFQLATKIQERYNLLETKLTTKIEHLDDIKVEIGEVGEFKPNMEISRWDSEVKMKIKPRLNVVSKKKELTFENEKIKYKEDKKEYHLYEMATSTEHPEGAYEFEIILLEKPDTNIVSFDIETKGLNFYYQPALNVNSEIDCDETHCWADLWDGLHKTTRFRPENVVNSYAVYHENKKNDYSQLGLKNYGTGKAFHIYRPKIIDTAGTEIWGKLNIINNFLTIEIPQEFLNNAIYPIIVDPTFGWGDPVTPGGSGTNFENKISGSLFTITEDGTGSSMTAYTSSSYGAKEKKYAIYKHSDLSRIGTTTANTADGWDTLNFVENPSLISGTGYVLVAWSEDAYQNSYLHYDTGDSNQAHIQELTYNGFPATATFTHSEFNEEFSIYCTYTAGGGAARRIFTTD